MLKSVACRSCISEMRNDEWKGKMKNERKYYFIFLYVKRLFFFKYITLDHRIRDKVKKNTSSLKFHNFVEIWRKVTERKLA